MEYIIGLIVALFAGLLFFEKKSKDNAAKAKLAEAKGQDKELAIQQEEVIKAIEDLDAGVDKLEEERKAEAEKRKNMTLKERADEAKKRYQK